MRNRPTTTALHNITQHDILSVSLKSLYFCFNNRYTDLKPEIIVLTKHLRDNARRQTPVLFRSQSHWKLHKVNVGLDSRLCHHFSTSLSIYSISIHIVFPNYNDFSRISTISNNE